MYAECDELDFWMHQSIKACQHVGRVSTLVLIYYVIYWLNCAVPRLCTCVALLCLYTVVYVQSCPSTKKTCFFHFFSGIEIPLIRRSGHLIGIT